MTNSRVLCCNNLNRVEERLLKAKKSYVQIHQEHKTKEIKSTQCSTPVPRLTHQSLLEEVQNHSRTELTKKSMDDEYKLVRFNASLSPGSRKILEKIERYGRVEDRLLQAGAKLDKDIIAKQTITLIESQMHARPSISPYANRLRRKGNASDRLSNEAEVRKEKLKSLQIKYDSSFTFSPKINKIPSPLRGAVSERRSTKELKPVQFSFKPVISQMSQKLAAKLGKSKDRLLTPPKKIMSDEFKTESECSFYPITNPRSTTLDNRQKVDENGKRTPRCLALYELHKAKLQSNYTGELEVTQQQNCTFMPMTNSKSTTNSSSIKIEDRLNNWAIERELKLKHKREEEEVEVLTQCTFSPKISGYASQSDINILHLKGVDKFLDRQFKAKLTKQSDSDFSPTGLMTFGHNHCIDNSNEHRGFQILNSNDFLEAVKNLHEELRSF